jgi:hypothetical protein
MPTGLVQGLTISRDDSQVAFYASDGIAILTRFGGRPQAGSP